MMVFCVCDWNGKRDFVLLNYDFLTTYLGGGGGGMLLGEQKGEEGKKGGH